MAENGNNSITDYDGSDSTRDGGTARTIDIDAGRDTKPAGNRATLAGFDLYEPGEIIDGGTGGGDGTADSQPRRRGRPKGSKNRTSGDNAKTAAQGSIAENLERLLVSVHTMGAAFLSCEELELDPEEAKQLARAIREVSKHYPVTLDPKRLALIELGTVMAMVYGTRGVAIYRRVTKEQKKGPAVVQNINEKKPPQNSTQTAPAQTSQTQSKPNGVDKNRLLNPSDLFGAANGVEDETVY